MSKFIRTIMCVLALSAGTLSVHADIFVNDEAPGVRLTNIPGKGECWVNSNGDFLATKEEAKPFKDIDKFYIAQEKNMNKGPMGPKKEWDAKRDCYVWRTSNGDFLGRDISSLTEDDKRWLAEQNWEWFEQNGLPDEINDLLLEQAVEQAEKDLNAQELAEEKLKEKLAQEKEAAKKADQDKKQKQAEAQLKKADQQMAMTDAEVQAALAEIAKARRELRAAGATEYESYLDEAEASIRQAQALSKQYKNKRGGQK